jgi:hypothetical protein
MDILAIVDRIVLWFNVEPAVSLLMVITAIVMFASAVTRVNDESPTVWQWTRKIIESSIAAFLFLGLLWGFRSILNTNYAEFYSTHGSASDVARQSAESIWGRPHTQRDLGYAHYAEVTVQEQIPRENPDDPPEYVDKVVRQHIPQNSMIGFVGDVNLTLSEREKGYARYNGYLIDARYQYQVQNKSEYDTDVEFDFALTSGQRLYDNFSITVDGEDVGDLLFNGDVVRWTSPFKSQQTRTVVVSYSSRGMGSYYYQIPYQREIRNFELTVTLDQLPIDMVNYPDGVLSPMSLTATEDGQGSILHWELDHAITTAGMGVSLPQPEQAGAEVLRVLQRSPYAITLLSTMVALTLLLLGQNVNFLVLGLTAAIYSGQFLVMAAVSDYQLGFWGAMIVGALISLFMTVILFRTYPWRVLRWLIYGLVAFFTLAYPLSGLLQDDILRNSFDNLVQFALIAFLFGVAVYVRSQHTKIVETATES